MIPATYNPDVLTCLANLSSDEVFTPPGLANDLLDLLPDSLWSDPDARFLDPFTKSGVFLREMAKRLDHGLAEAIPDREERIKHIFGKQLHGIAITSLTALLARRSLYCSRNANGKYSVADDIFATPDGNIRFNRVEHTWQAGKCRFCGASQIEYERDESLESHAYEFIHTDNPQELFNMKFDVIIGNPPYQMSDGGHGRSASPIYNDFVKQAKRLAPSYLAMIIPSRWFGGGKGLSEFRSEMLNDEQIRKIVDFEDPRDVFAGVDIPGGVCYFLWQKGTSGPCEIVNMHGQQASTSIRCLNEFRTFVRHSQAVPIIRKVQSHNEMTLNKVVSSAKPFGLRTFARPKKQGDLILRWHSGSGPYPRDEIVSGRDIIDRWKVITSKVSYDHGGMPDKNGMRRVLSIVDVLPPGTICTETYLVVNHFDNQEEAENLAAFLRTRFARFLIAQLVFSQDMFKEKFEFVPVLDVTRSWSDEQLYEKYKITIEEVEFIESKIRPMESTRGA